METIADIQYYFILFFLWLASYFILHYLFKRPGVAAAAPLRLPPSPPSYPIIGHLHLLSKAFYDSFQKIAAKYGPLLYLRLGGYPCVLVSSATMATELFKTQDINLSGKPRSPFEDRLLFGNLGFITSQYGDYWRFMKKLCVTELLGSRQILRSRGIRREELQGFLRKMTRKASKEEVVDMGGELMKLTNAGICRMALSTKHAEEDDEAELCRKLVMDSLDLAGKINSANVLGPFKRVIFWLYGKQSIDVIKRLDVLLERILKEHEERVGKAEEDKDLMDILLEAHRDEKAEVRITRDEVKAFIMDLFVAGTSTTAETTQWALANMINRPDVYNKVRQEIDLVVGKDRLVDESDVANLPYLQAVTKETLRLYAPLPVIPRANRETCKFGDYDIPQGTTVLINAYAMMRDPNLWEKPFEFYPERFLVPGKENGMENKETKGLNFSFLPFGMGRRMCPGSTLAMTTINAALAAMVQCFDWEVVGGDGDNKVNLEIGISITTSMAHPLTLIPKVRFNPLAA